MDPNDNQQNQPEDVSIEKLENDLNEAMNGWKRAAADFENYKKQKEKENRELVEFAREVTVAKLLPTLDVLEQALKHLPVYPSPQPSSPLTGEDVSRLARRSLDEGGSETDEGESFAKKYSNWQIGIKGILMQLDGVLGELGIKKIEAIGKKFDPHLHEAVREQESEEDDGTIIDELQTGFMLNGKVIRPSQVIISKKK